MSETKPQSTASNRLIVAAALEPGDVLVSPHDGATVREVVVVGDFVMVRFDSGEPRRFVSAEHVAVYR